MFYNILLSFFYIWSIPAILFELWMINKTFYNKIIDFNKKCKDEPGKFTGSEWLFTILILGYYLWMTIGLFSSQWIFFLGLWILSFISTGLTKFKVIKYIWNVIDSIISIALIFSIILNKYHWHFQGKDIWKELFHLFT